jgi:hypothetical protein
MLGTEQRQEPPASFAVRRTKSAHKMITVHSFSRGELSGEQQSGA